MADFPGGGSALTHILVVNDVYHARDFYRDVLGAEVTHEYGGTSVVLRFLDAWLLLVTGGGPTDDKPETHLSPPSELNNVNHLMTIRVADCQQAYTELKARGAQFITPPINSGFEIRCFFRDPDGHLLEISQVENLPTT